MNDKLIGEPTRPDSVKVLQTLFDLPTLNPFTPTETPTPEPDRLKRSGPTLMLFRK